MKPEEKKSDALFIRMKPSDREVIDKAVEATYGPGESQGMTTEWVTKVLLAYAKKVLLKKGKWSDGQQD